jgi:protoporphyrinogen oxidase
MNKSSTKSGSEKHVVVVGGGMLGLTMALRLRETGARVTVLESASEVGGLAAAWSIGDLTWDKYYHVILLSDLALRGVLDEIGVGDDMRWTETRTGFFTDGELYSMSDTLEFLRFPPLGLIDKLRLGGTIFFASRMKNWQALEEQNVGRWLERLSGRNTYERIWQPLLRAKLGDNHSVANAAFIWSTINRMYAARRTGLKKEMMGFVEGGYAAILPALAKTLEERGVEIRLDSPVTRVWRGEDGTNRVEVKGRYALRADGVVVTAPADVAGKVVEGLSLPERWRLSQVVYQGVVCASMLVDEPLSDFYVTNITDDSPFTGIIEMTALLGRERLGGRGLLYLPRYLPQKDPFWDHSDAEVEEIFVSALERMYPGFTRDRIHAFQIARARKVMAVPTHRYSRDACPPTVTSIPGVFLVNGAQIVNGTLNVNESVMLANDKSALIARALSLPAPPAPRMGRLDAPVIPS